jgi:antitoxin CcdA
MIARYIKRYVVETVTKRKTSLTLNAQALDQAKELQINVSAVAETALLKAISDAKTKQWLAENAEAFAAQAQWHERNGHPLADIMAAPTGADLQARLKFWQHV